MAKAAPGAAAAAALVGALLVVYVAPQVVFKYSQTVQGFLLFMNRLDADHDFDQPLKFGLRCVRLLRLEHRPGSGAAPVELGAWHVLAGGACAAAGLNGTGEADQDAFADNRPIVLYVHGNRGSRAGDYRNRLYRRLAYEYDFHVVTFDYRGFGDSSRIAPSADGLTVDTEHMYRWLLAQRGVDRGRVVVWGHSLGTGVAVRALARMPEAARPRGLVLEAPFDSIANAVKSHPFSRPFRLVPKLFEHFVIEPIAAAHDLNSLEHVHRLGSTPMLILHAEDDPVIPIQLGQNLYRSALRAALRVDMIAVSAEHALGHRRICDHAETMAKVRAFIGAGEGEL